eukprot:Nk52_evm25s270 gene=Nk52_evmTU25s270
MACKACLFYNCVFTLCIFWICMHRAQANHTDFQYQGYYQGIKNSFTLIHGDGQSQVENGPVIDNTYFYGDPLFNPSGMSNGAAFSPNGDDLYFFGGMGAVGGNTNTVHNQLWKYRISRDEWKLMSGQYMNDTVQENTVNGTGPSTFSSPGSRSGHAGCYMGGRFWVFGGGNGKGLKQDLWAYHIATKQWEYFNNDSTEPNDVDKPGVGYPTGGTFPGPEDVLNVPGSREMHAIACFDFAMYIFGGYGFDHNGSEGYLNDIWKLNVTTLKWQMLSGNAANTSAQVPSQPMQELATSEPGGVHSSCMWSTHDYVLYIFGGTNDAASFNDVWRFNLDTLQWSIGTSNATGLVGNSTTFPSPRFGAACWRSDFGDLMLHAGISGGAQNLFYEQETWLYDTYEQKWASFSFPNAELNPPSSPRYEFSSSTRTTLMAYPLVIDSIKGTAFIYGGSSNNGPLHNLYGSQTRCQYEFLEFPSCSTFGYTKGVVYPTSGNYLYGCGDDQGCIRIDKATGGSFVKMPINIYGTDIKIDRLIGYDEQTGSLYGGPYHGADIYQSLDDGATWGGKQSLDTFLTNFSSVQTMSFVSVLNDLAAILNFDVPYTTFVGSPEWGANSLGLLVNENSNWKLKVSLSCAASDSKQCSSIV